jgi:hypothetical protein
MSCGHKGDVCGVYIWDGEVWDRGTAGTLNGSWKTAMEKGG